MLTNKQQMVLNFIMQYSNEHGYSPSVREIGEACGMRSSSTVQGHINNLRKNGYLSSDAPNKPRTLNSRSYTWESAQKSTPPHIAQGDVVISLDDKPVYVLKLFKQ